MILFTCRWDHIIRVTTTITANPAGNNDDSINIWYSLLRQLSATTANCNAPAQMFSVTELPKERAAMMALHITVIVIALANDIGIWGWARYTLGSSAAP